jgi:hypothetical protein
MMFYNKRFSSVNTLNQALLIVCFLVQNIGLKNYAINYKNKEFIVRYNTIY